MYSNPFDRKFGIEFEFGCRNIPGYDSEERRDNFYEILEESGLKNFNIGFDGSEWEVRTPPLFGPVGFKTVKNFLILLEELDAYTSTNADGLHVHHDAPEFLNSNAAIQRLVENWYINQDEIHKMVHSTRNNRWACPVWTNQDITVLRERIADGAVEIYRGFGRKNLNISSLARHGTIEIRLHEGTIDYEEVLSWVRFGQSFIGKALDEVDSYVPRMPAVDLLKRINVSRNASRFITRKIENQVVRYA